jgi:hypothetical protein
MCPRDPFETASLIVERRFAERNLLEGLETRLSKSLPAFYDRPAVVVLGDPGAGKTTSVGKAAQEEPNAMYTSVRDFLALNIERFRGLTLYLDALDAMRGRADGS